MLNEGGIGMGNKEVLKNNNDVMENSLLPTTYGLIYQNNVTNLLSCLPQKIIDDLVSGGEGNAFLAVTRKHVKDVQYWIVPCKVNLTGSTSQMFDYIVGQYTRSVYHNATAEQILDNEEIEINLKDVAKKFGMSMFGARKMVLRAVESLSNIKIDRLDIPVARKKVVKNERNVNEIIQWTFPIISEVGKYLVNDDKKQIKNSRMKVVLHHRLAEMLPKESYLMFFPDNLYKIHTSRYPNAYMFGRRLCLWYRQNIQKNPKVANTVKVKLLLDLALSLPKRDDIKKTGAIKQRIICPFVRDLDILVEKKVLSKWYLIDKFSGKPVEHPQTIAYDRFETSKIWFELYNYPTIDIKEIA